MVTTSIDDFLLGFKANRVSKETSERKPFLKHIMVKAMLALVKQTGKKLRFL